MKKIILFILLLILITGCGKKEVNKAEPIKIESQEEAQKVVQNISSNMEAVSNALTDLEKDLENI